MLIPSMSSHPARKAITLHFNSLDGVSLRIELEGYVLDEVISFARMTIRNYQPWILECFDIVTDRHYQCKMCSADVFIDENRPGIIDAARNHLNEKHKSPQF